VDTADRANTQRFLETLQDLLEAPAGDLKTALTHAADAIAAAMRADKVDAFLYDDRRDSLVAVGVSNQPLSNLQKSLGLDVLPVSNGGRVVQVYTTGKLFHTGNLLQDPEELRGVKEGLRIQSKVGIPLEIGGRRRGMIMVASLQPDYFTADDANFIRSAAHWVGVVAHRAELVEHIERNALEDGRRQVAEELITVLAHDLRNYLSPVVLRLYALRHRAQTDNRTADTEDANVALTGVTRLNGLLANLLDVARLDEGIFQMHLEPVDIGALVSEAAGVLATQEHQIIVKASQPVIVAADPMRIRQCVDNVLSNAIHHSPRGAAVSVFIDQEPREGGVCGKVEIVDEGPGIPDDVLPRLFDRFLTGRGGQGGVGLGLYIAKRIATAHRGDVVADRYPGKGARFTIRLPLFEQARAGM
jgi:two-component system, OmpR family, sensor kinase